MGLWDRARFEPDGTLTKSVGPAEGDALVPAAEPDARTAAAGAES